MCVCVWGGGGGVREGSVKTGGGGGGDDKLGFTPTKRTGGGRSFSHSEGDDSLF